MLVQTKIFLRYITAELFSNNSVTLGHLSANVNLKNIPTGKLSFLLCQFVIPCGNQIN